MKKDTEATRRKPADEKTGTKKPRRTRLIALEPRMLFEGEALTEVRPTDVHQPDAGAKAPTAPQAGAAAPAGEAGTQPAPVDGKSTVLTTDQAGADKTVSADEAGAAPAIEKPGEAARVVEPRAGTERTNVSIISTDLLDAETRENLRQSIDIVEQSLQKFAESAEFKTVMTEIFGGTRSSADFDAAVEQLRAQIENGTLEVRVEVVSSQVLGVHGGAYAAVGAEGKEAIYLNADMLKTATAKEVAGVVLEELGHALDQRINLGVDTIGDEGQLFADRIVGQALTADQAQDIVSEDDHGTLRFADRLVGVEFAAQSPPSSANQTIASFAEDGTPVDLDVSAITFNDPNANDTLKGIVITANNATSAQGTWQYSTDGGTTWSAVGTVSTNNALWLSSNGTTNSIRFLPTGNYSGTVGTLSYYVVSSSDTVSRSDGTRYSIPGSGGTKFGTTDYSTSTYTITQSAIVSSNDAPTVTVAASNSSFSEGAGFGVQGAAVAVFSGSSVSTVESGQSISGLAFTVSGLRDGASETVVVDGTTLSLGGNSAGITLGRLMTYSVTVSGDTATVSLAKLTGVSTSEAQSVIDGIRYQNKNVDDPTGGARTFTLTQLKDTGGTANGGVDTAALSVTSVINVVPVNDAPTHSVTALGPTYNQFASPVALFAGATAGAVESTQSLTSLTLTVSGIADGASEKLTVSGTEFALTNGTAGTLDGTNSVAYSVTTSGNTATITLASASGLSASGMQSLISGIGYRDVSQHPTAGQRIATITRITDSGGSAAGGNDATTLALSSVVTVVPDTTAPDAPTLSLIQSSDTGQSTSDRVTADDTPTVRVALNGSGASAPLAGDVVKVQANGVLVGTVSLTSAHLQAGYVDVTTASVAGDGTHTLTATVTDAAGNTSSASSPLTLTLDRTPPQAPTLALLSTSDTGASSSDRITADDTPTIRVALNGSGASAPVVGDVVTVRSSGAVVGTATLTSAHVQAGYVDVTTASLGADGVKSLTATVTDKAGNESTPSSSLAITLDRTAPALTQAVVDGSRLTLSYSDSVDLDDTNRASPSAYIVTANGVPSSVSAIAVDGTSRTVTLTLAAPVSAGQIVTVAYVDPSVSDDSQATQDLAGNDATSALSLTVTNVTVDHVPQAVADSAAIAEDADTAITGNVLVDDTLGDGTAALHTVTWGNEAAQYGTLTKNADGSYSYVLDNGITEVQRLAPGQFLTETFTYTVRDADGDTATSALTITITGTNDGPVALNTSAQGASSVAVQLSALDTDGTVSTFVLSSLPAHGTLYTDASMTHIVEAGAEYAATNDSLTLYFRPDAGWTGQTNFEFVARDEAGAYADTATATISVSSSTADVYEDGLTRNPPQPESATGALPGGAAGGWSMQSDAQHGTATLGSDGTWSYTVNNDDPAVQALGEGETLVDTFVVSGPRILSTTVQIGDGRSPLTSGHDQTTVLTLPTEFLEGMQAGKLDSSKLTLYTDFQKAPFTTPVSADEQNVGLEEQVEARLVVGSKTFIAVQRNDGQQTWSFDAASGLMKAQVGFDEIVEAQYDAESRSWIPVASGATLKDFLQGNPSIPAQWTAVYDDNEGGPEQARIARFEFTTLGGTPVQETITVTIHGTNDAPVAVADVNTVGEDGAPVSGNVLTNDTDV
ncbi:MAG: VCBS domain-containing protein, partial [Rhodospirillaceae bacterium]